MTQTQSNKNSLEWMVQAKVHVRFADVDSMGHVNNAKYFTYLEQGRVEYFKRFAELDFTAGQSSSGISVILAEIKCSFRSPVFLDEFLRVKVRTREVKRSSFIMEYEIIEEKSGRLVATGESVMVYYDYAKGKSLEIPLQMRKRFEEIEGREFEQ
jgi:acyl-CoA thioester hydrolase